MRDKFTDWKILVSERAEIEIKLLDAADKYFSDLELEELNRMLLNKDYRWAGFVFEIMTMKANFGYMEMKIKANKT